MNKSEDLLCRYFTDTIIGTPTLLGRRKIRAVLPWIGLIVAAIQEHGYDIEVLYTRQLAFNYSGKRFKVRYKHDGLQSGILIAMVEKSRGNPVIREVTTIRCLADAVHFYNNAKMLLTETVKPHIIVVKKLH